MKRLLEGILTLRSYKKYLQGKKRKFLHMPSEKGFLSMDVCAFEVVCDHVSHSASRNDV